MASVNLNQPDRQSTESTEHDRAAPTIPNDSNQAVYGTAIPFATSNASIAEFATGSSTALHLRDTKWFRSRKIKKGTVDRPWLDKKDPRAKWVTIIPVMGLLLGLAVSGFLVWGGVRSITNHKYCAVLTEDWSGGIDSKIWTKEAEVGGFG